MQLSFRTSDIVKQQARQGRTPAATCPLRLSNGRNLKCRSTNPDSNASVNHNLHPSSAQPIRKRIVTRFQTSEAEQTFHSLVPVQRNIVLVTESSSKGTLRIGKALATKASQRWMMVTWQQRYFNHFLKILAIPPTRVQFQMLPWIGLSTTPCVQVGAASASL